MWFGLERTSEAAKSSGPYDPRLLNVYSTCSSMTTHPPTIHTSPADFRRAVRSGAFDAPTAGQCLGHVHTNLVIVPADAADEFAEFCRLNPQPCPLVARTLSGDAEPRGVAPGADLRCDVPRYRAFRNGVPQSVEPSEVFDLWQDDFVAFLLGCSFTFENALEAAGLHVRHIHERRNVPMFRTSVPCQGAGRFQGNLVVSMRPYRPEQVDEVRRITSRYPRMHGAPVHVGDPAAIGIHDLHHPEFGEAVTIQPDEVPVFWACGVTPQLALLNARLPLAITHSPGYMFVTDMRDEEFCDP